MNFFTRKHEKQLHESVVHALQRMYRYIHNELCNIDGSVNVQDLWPQEEEGSNTISLSRRLQDMVSVHRRPLKKYPYDFSGKLFY